MTVVGATRMPISPTTTPDSTQVAAASRCGEYPANAAVRSFSAAAIVANPVLVYRNQAATSAVTIPTTAVSHSRSCGNVSPAIEIESDGMIGATGRDVVPNWRAVSAWKNNRTPTDATTLASTGAWRSGRNTNTWSSTPISAQEPTPMAKADQNGAAPPRSILCGSPTTGITRSPLERSSAYTYVPHIAVAPVAKLITPVPRNVMITPTPIAAYRQPTPRPIKAKMRYWFTALLGSRGPAIAGPGRRCRRSR